MSRHRDIRNRAYSYDEDYDDYYDEEEEEYHEEPSPQQQRRYGRNKTSSLYQVLTR